MSGERRVAIVVSDEYAPHVERLARDCPVWVVRTPETEAITQQLREREGDGEPSVTLFKAGREGEASLISILDEVELHHGEASGHAPVGVIEVLGAQASAAIWDHFRLLGFPRLATSPDGFEALRERSD